MRRSRVSFGLVAASLSLLGCQSPGSLSDVGHAAFVLGAPDGEAPTAIAARPTSGVGVLTVQVSKALKALHRRVLASVADVDHVLVSVHAADGSDTSQTVEKAALSTGSATATFPGLAVGQATVTVTAYDAAGHVIGTISKPATVTTGQTASVDVPLQLAPTYVPNGSGGGGSSPTTGGLTANVTLQDGPKAYGPFPAGDHPIDVAIDSLGNPWVLTNMGSSLVRLGANGEMLTTYALSINFMVGLRIDGNDSFYTSSPSYGLSVDKTGQLINGAMSGGTFPTNGGFALDAQNRVVYPVYMAQTLAVKAAGSASETVFSLPFPGDCVAVDSHGDYWVSEFGSTVSPTRVCKVSPSGTVLGTYSVPGHVTALERDGQGAVWAVSTTAITKLDAAGNAVVSLPSIGKIHVDRNDHLWIRGLDKVHHYDAQGALLASFDVPAEDTGYAGGLTTDAAGNMWVVNMKAGSVLRFAL